MRKDPLRSRSEKEHGEVTRQLLDEATSVQEARYTRERIGHVRRTYHLPPELAEWVMDQAHRSSTIARRVTESAVVAEAIVALRELRERDAG